MMVSQKDVLGAGSEVPIERRQWREREHEGAVKAYFRGGPRDGYRVILKAALLVVEFPIFPPLPVSTPWLTWHEKTVFKTATYRLTSETRDSAAYDYEDRG